MSRLKFSPEKKVEIIEAYKSGRVAKSQLREVYGMNPATIFKWLPQYEANGISAFITRWRKASSRNRRHIPIQQPRASVDRWVESR